MCDKRCFPSYAAAEAEIKKLYSRQKHNPRRSERRPPLSVYRCEVCPGDVFHLTSKHNHRIELGRMAQ